MRQGAFLSIVMGLACWAGQADAAEWTADLGMTSDYRYRGLSLSGRDPVLQASVSVEQSSGVYLSLWGTTLGRGPGNVELDASAGVAFALGRDLAVDLSATYYTYPHDPDANAVEGTATVQWTRGAFDLSAGASFAPPQAGTRDEDGRKRGNLYVFAGLGFDVPSTPLTARGRIGRERGAWDEIAHGPKWDTAIGVEARFQDALLSLEYVGSNVADEALVASLMLTF